MRRLQCIGMLFVCRRCMACTGLLVAIAIGAIVGIVVGCIFLLTVFIFRKRCHSGFIIVVRWTIRDSL